MKYQVGDIVLILHSNEEGKVVDIINNKMMTVDVKGVIFPVYMDQVDFPYFKRFSEKKIVPVKKTNKYVDDLRKEKQSTEKKQEDGNPLSEATVMIKVGDMVEHTAAVGTGPVNALDHALRKALEKFYPQLREVKLLDYKVRVLAANRGTESKVRVLIESGDHKDKWGTVGVSENIIEATWQALADSIEYKLLDKD